MTAGFSSGVPFAVDEEGRWRDVDLVERGKDCRCFCAECKSPLVARKGYIRVHHFAHSDRRECQDALQASLFGMAAIIMGETNSELQAPPLYTVPEMSLRIGRSERDVREAMIEAGLDDRLRGEKLVLKNPVTHAYSVHDSSPEKPDVESGLLGLQLHFLSARKRLPALENAVSFNAAARVLAVNLIAFAWRWRQVCDQRNLRDHDLPPSAIGEFRKWLAQSNEGRGWVRHSERDAAVQQIQKKVPPLPSVRPTPPTVTASFFSPPNRTWSGPKKRLPPEPPEELLTKDAGICQRCAAPLDEVRLGSGLYTGKRVLVCRVDRKHPMVYKGL